MEITKEFLQKRIDGLMQQRDDLLRQAAQVEGAIRDCQMLIEFLAEQEEGKDAEHQANVQ